MLMPRTVQLTPVADTAPSLRLCAVYGRASSGRSQGGVEHSFAPRKVGTDIGNSGITRLFLVISIMGGGSWLRHTGRTGLCGASAEAGFRAQKIFWFWLVLQAA